MSSQKQLNIFLKSLIVLGAKSASKLLKSKQSFIVSNMRRKSNTFKKFVLILRQTKKHFLQWCVNLSKAITKEELILTN
jgi:hypothetical protein